jgi:hypothetical protein
MSVRATAQQESQMTIHHAPSKPKKHAHHLGNGHDHEPGNPIVHDDKTDSHTIVSTNLARTTVAQVVRKQTIAELAYQHAEARGFAPGHELEDWLAAEHELSVQLSRLVSDQVL